MTDTTTTSTPAKTSPAKSSSRRTAPARRDASPRAQSDASSSAAADGSTPPRYTGVRRGGLCDFTTTDPLSGEQVSGVGVVVDHNDDGVVVAPLPTLGWTIPHDAVQHR